MKKVLFILCSTLISNSLFSDPTFSEETYKKIVGEFIGAFLKNVEQDVNSLNYLKYIAEIYLEVLPNVENYENGLKKLDRYILSQNVEKIREKFEFAEENKDPFYVYVIFQKIIKAWVTKSKDAKLEQAGELKIPVDQSNPAAVGETVATMFSLSGDELQTFKKEEAEIFTQILIEACDERIESKRQADLTKKVAIGIATGALTIAGFQGIRTMNVKMPNLGSASNRDFTKKIIATGIGIAAVTAIGAAEVSTIAAEAESLNATLDFLLKTATTTIYNNPFFSNFLNQHWQ